MSRGASYRLVIWQDVLQRLVHHCGVAFGCGNDDYRFLGEFFHPHSGYLSVLYRYGAFVAVIGALWIASYWYWGVRLKSRSEQHTSELQSLMRISYAVFCLKKKKHNKRSTRQQYTST